MSSPAPSSPWADVDGAGSTHTRGEVLDALLAIGLAAVLVALAVCATIAACLVGANILSPDSKEQP